MLVSFYGTRGSIATPGESTFRYGGNTSCVEVVSNAGTRVVIDAGTGAAALGRRISGDGKPVRAHLLISHTHWDHIQGIPFFSPLFIPGNEWDIYGPRGLGESLSETLAGQMEYTYFPVAMEQMGAAIRYHDLVEGQFTVGDIVVTSHYLNHPALTLGYRLEADGAVVVYACDHEPYASALGDGQGKIVGEDERHAEFLAGADLVIHDAQYLASEYNTKHGWGHSTPEYAFAVSRFGRVKRLALTHHDPMRDDGAIDGLVSAVRAKVAGKGGPEIFAAAEGQSIELAGKSEEAEAPDEPRAMERVDTALAGRSVLLVLADPNQQDELAKVAVADGFTVFAAAPSEAVSMADRERPSVILICEELGDAVEMCRAIRKIDDYGADVPVILVTRDARPCPDAAPFSDRLVEPFSPTYARTRLRAWVMRVAARWSPSPMPDDEAVRLAVTRGLGILDTVPEERFDRITRLASALFHVPVSLISLIDDERQWFKSACGIDIRETPRDVSLCSHTIYHRAPLILRDALFDERFCDNPYVKYPPRIRFYAGYPLILDNGACVGSICLADTRPRDLDDDQMARFRDLAELTTRELQRGTEKAAYETT